MIFFCSVNEHVCPGGQQTCPDAYTCCTLVTGGYGCCPFKDGVCCSDQVGVAWSICF